MSAAKSIPMQRDWLSKTLAGLLLGFLLALGASDLFTLLNPGIPGPARVQLAMWLFAPVWLGVLSGCYFFSSGRSAWVWLQAASLALFCLLIALHA